MKKSNYTPKPDGQSAEDRALSTFAELEVIPKELLVDRVDAVFNDCLSTLYRVFSTEVSDTLLSD